LNMRKFIIMSLVAILVNLFYLSVSHGQTDINVSGYVPETELNKNVSAQMAPKAVTKENKYQYFFEKFLSQKENKSTKNQEGQTIYDKIASNALMWVIIIILAALFLFILRYLARYFKNIIFKKR
ncbi:MAG: hypothetical protein NT116_06705, partial [Candidatus Parcubacteria bacterium]|nr:hypothetical protein [Candidatus Parcubacteria bacterium]